MWEERRLRVTESRVLRDEVTREWRNYIMRSFNDLYSSPNIIRVKKSRSTRWTGLVARLGRRGET